MGKAPRIGRLRAICCSAPTIWENVCIDPTGRLLLPKGVRDALATSQRRVHLVCNESGSVSIHSQEQMEQKLAASRDTYADAGDTLFE